MDPLRDPFFIAILPGIERFWQLNDSSFEKTNCRRFHSVQLLSLRINAPFDTLHIAGQAGTALGGRMQREIASLP